MDLMDKKELKDCLRVEGYCFEADSKCEESGQLSVGFYRRSLSRLKIESYRLEAETMGLVLKDNCLMAENCFEVDQHEEWAQLNEASKHEKNLKDCLMIESCYWACLHEG